MVPGIGACQFNEWGLFRLWQVSITLTNSAIVILEVYNAFLSKCLDIATTGHYEIYQLVEVDCVSNVLMCSKICTIYNGFPILHSVFICNMLKLLDN